TILNRKAIAKISRTPGKTRLINFFEIRFKTNDEKEGFINFVDLPGYGYAKVSKAERESWKKMIQNYFDNRLQLRGVIAIIDIRHKSDPKDIVMFEMLKTKQIPFVVIATKSDKIRKTKAVSSLRKLISELKLENQGIIQFSSFKKIGINEVLNWISSRIL
ncbi:MAG: ribosome biogenesis GTP-binding protein YsxC, partial [Candidatus Cloacimonetes bacterium]|nr:ribosome biogenesis GTP-binding protein YsxC [Candidatus Cloacimonadota bacterium]